MPTYTTTYSLGKPVVGADEDAWGDTLNASLDAIDDILDGTTPVTGIDINSGTLDGVTIGGTSAGAGTFTNLTATGTTTLAGASTSADITFGDNDKAIFGAGSDLQIYHDGAGGSSYITESGAGSLYIQGTNLRLQSATGEQFLTGDANNNVKLYYDNSERIATTSTGIDVTGTITADGLTVDGTATINNIIDMTGSTANYIKAATSGGDLRFITNEGGTNKQRVIIANNGDISFYEDTGTTAKFFWDASAESLGIGTSSPFRQLQVGNYSSDATLALAAGSTNFSSLFFSDGDGAPNRYVGSVQYNHASNYMLFNTSGSEAMRIDSSGNLLVGKTSSNTGVAGTEIYSGSSAGVLALAYAGRPLYINRLSTDGGIIDFAKDGTTVGSIGTAAGDLSIGSDDAFLFFDGGANKIVPASTSSGGASNGLLDLGASDRRFKDLYLSGGVYLGGTGSANLLDDYESGAFGLNTASDPTGALDSNSYGYYVKVGEMVTVQIVFQCTSNFTSNVIGGLPFAPINYSAVVSGVHGGGTLMYSSSKGFTQINHASTSIYFYDNSGAAVNPSTTNDPFRFTITYRTS